VQICLDSGAIHFKFHDQVRHRSAFKERLPGQRKVMSVSVPYDLQGCAHLAISAHTRGSPPIACTVSELTRTKSKGLMIDVHQHLYYASLHVQRRVQKVKGS
jgi:hypothetical protein